MRSKSAEQRRGSVVDLSRLLEITASFPRQTIAVIGDFIADEYVTGEISRISREAPVLILRHQATEFFPGGAANAANNLIALGARVLPVGAVGDDAAADALIGYFRAKGVDVSGILRMRGASTTTKTRFVARWSHTARQQVLRVDREAGGPLPKSVQAKLHEKLCRSIAKSDAALVSDYHAGSATPEILKGMKTRLAMLDSRYRLLDYRGQGFTAATPNEPELEALYGVRIGKDEKRLEQFGLRTLRAMKLQALLVTRGKDGMVLFERGKPPYQIPIYGADDAVDVTGAGDTVIAIFTLALAAGASFVEAAHLANYGGGIVVMKRGTATVSRAELEAAIRSEASGAR
jgi:D-glycero-beta-D-manno-heptose-7-phosphate kinase